MTAALSNLADAQTAEANFLNDQVDNELLEGLGLDENSGLQDIRDAIDTAVKNASDALSTHRTNEGSDNVIQAYLQDAQEALTAATADVNEVDGLMKKIEARDATQKAYEAAQEATVEAEADALGAVTTFDNRAARADDNVDATYNAPVAGAEDVDVVVDAGNAGAPMIRINADGDLVIEDAYTDTVGIQNLYAAVEAHVAAINAEDSALEARNDAAAEISDASEVALANDFTPDSTAFKGVETGFTADSNAFTDAQAVVNSFTADSNAFTDAQTNVADFGTESTAFTNAQTALTDFNALVTTYQNALSAYDTAEAGGGTSTSTEQNALVSAYQALSAAYTTSEEATVTIGGSDSATDAAAVKGAESAIGTDISEEVTALEGAIGTAATALFVETTVDVTVDYTADYSAEITAEETARDTALTTAGDELFVETAVPSDLTVDLTTEIAAENTAREAALTTAGDNLFVETAVPADLTADLTTEIAAEGTARLEAAAEDLFVLTEAPADLSAVTDADIAAEGTAREEAATEASENAGLVSDYDAAVTAVEDAQDVIEKREELKAEVEATEALNDEADALADAVDEADAALTNAEDADPAGLGVTLLEGADNFTSEDDVYLYAEAEGNQQLGGFGANGEDKIFFGESFSLVEIPEGDTIADNVGDVATQEILWQEDGANLMLYVEAETFGGNASGTDDVVTIELTGVSFEDVNFADGYLTAGEVA